MKLSSEKIKVAILGVLEEIMNPDAMDTLISHEVRNVVFSFDVEVMSNKIPEANDDDDMVMSFVMDFEKLHLFNGGENDAHTSGS